MVKVGGEFVRTEAQFISAKLKVIDHYKEIRECRVCRKRGEPCMEKAPVPYPPVMHSRLHFYSRMADPSEIRTRRSIIPPGKGMGSPRFEPEQGNDIQLAAGCIP